MSAKSLHVDFEWWAVKDQMPDDGSTVLFFSTDASASEPVWLGYHDGELGWRSVDGEPVHRVTHWANMPDGPLPKRVKGRA